MGFMINRSTASAVLGSALLLAAAHPVAAAEKTPAQSTAQPPGAVNLGDITVTSTRVDKSLYKVPAAISAVSQDDIQLARQELGLDESLAGVPGVFFQNRYNFGQGLRIAIRGFGARANFGIRGVKIFVDGIPDTTPDGQATLNDVDLGSAKRIEVIRGPSSSLYGSAAGGVISIYTEDGPPQPMIEGRTNFGSYGFRNYQLKAGGQKGKLNYFANLSHLDYGGYRVHSATQNTMFNSKFKYQIDSSSDFTTVINAVDTPVADDPGGLTAKEVAANREQAAPNNLKFDAGKVIDQQRVGFVYHKHFNAKNQIMLRNYYVWRGFANKLPFQNGGAVAFNRFFFGGGGQYINSDSLLGHHNRVTVGFDVDRQSDDRTRRDNNYGVLGALSLNQNELVTSYGVFAQNEFSILNNVELTTGARYDVINFDVTDHFLVDGNNSGSLSFDHVSPMVGLRWTPVPAVNLYGNVSTSFETPTTTEFANPNNNGAAGGFNPNLKPQTAINYEIGAKGLLAGRLSYNLALFTIDVKDELVPYELPGQSGRSFYRNAGKSTRNGLEAGVSFHPLSGLTTSLSYTYSDFTFDSYRTVDSAGNVSIYDGNRIPGVPRHLFHAEVSYYHPSGFYVDWDLLYASSFFANDANTVSTGNYTVANIRAGFLGHYGGWDITPYVGINNMFNQLYIANVRLNAGYGRYFEPAPELNVYGGLSLRYNFGT